MPFPPLYYRYSKQNSTDRLTGEIRTIFIPKVPCRFKNGNRTMADHGILDSGADCCVINIEMARQLDLDLRKAQPMRVVGNDAVESYTARAELILGSGKCTDPIPVEVRIPAVGDTPTLIGRDPVFSIYNITFIEREKKIQLVPYRDELTGR